MKQNITRQEMLNAIILAAQKGFFFADVQMVEYTVKKGNGKSETWVDRFSHIDLNGNNPMVWYIAGTGYKNNCFPIEAMTDKSVKEFYECIPTNDYIWSDLLTQTNEELRPYGAMLIVDEYEEGNFSMEILYGLDKENPNILQYQEREDFAENYYNNEMEELINQACAYAKRKVKKIKPLWAVTCTTLSDSEYHANGYTEVKVCDSIEKAQSQMKQWADGEIAHCKEEKRDYEILQDEPAEFRMGWCGNTEQIRINIREVAVNE